EQRHAWRRAAEGERARAPARAPAHGRDRPRRCQLLTLHQRRRPPRTAVACRIPIATGFVIIDEPPTETNGSGIPVIGAIPIVMPTFTKIWKSRATTIPPATIAE